MKSDEILIIQYPYRMSQQRVDALREQILKQKETGVILLSDLCTVMTKSKDTDIQVELETEAANDPLKKHCLSCKSCDPFGCGASENHGYCFLNCKTVNLDDVACEHYMPF